MNVQRKTLVYDLFNAAGKEMEPAGGDQDHTNNVRTSNDGDLARLLRSIRFIAATRKGETLQDATGSNLALTKSQK